MKHPKRLAGILILAIVVLAGFEGIRTIESILEALSEERSFLKDNSTVQFRRTELTPQTNRQIRIWQDYSDTRGIADFRGSLFAATAGGLVEYSYDGNMKRHYTVLDGLPESDLTSIAAFRDRLYIGTRSEGLVEYDGSGFAAFEWPGRDQQTVTALVNEADRRLVIGTFNGGLLSYSGGVFTERKAENNSLKKIENIEVRDGRVFVSTFDNGLWIVEGASWQHIRKEDGLPSVRVTGTTIMDGKLFVATDLGPAECDGGRCFQKAMLPAVSGIAQNGGRTFLSRDNGEIYSLGEELSLLGRARGEYSGYRLSEAGGRNFLVGGGGIFEIRDNRLVRFGNGPDGEPGSNFVSALYADAKGQIWMGAFRGGIDVRTGEGRLIKHIGSEGIHEINFLGAGPNGSVVAATTGGLVKIDGSLSPIGGADDRMAGPVNHVSGDLLSTPRGLLFAKKEGSKLLTAENRLPSNSVYTTLSKGGSIWVGTLSGLAQVRGERVVRVWKDSNSRLTTNWVTALASIGERIFIGTYGGGVYEILPSGEVHSLLSAGEGFVVNMNALDTNGKRLYAGTMDGIRSMDLETGAWETFRTGLPAKTVMSIIHNRGRIYAGTTNGVAVIGDDEFGLQERAAK